MRHRRLAPLFVCALAAWTVGNGLLPLLPVHAARLGAAPAATGAALATCFLALSAGTMVAGGIHRRARTPRRHILALAAANLPLIWWTGRTTSLVDLAMATSGVFFLGGALITSVAIIATQSTAPAERGRVFGVLGTCGPLGSLVAGLSFGAIADAYGFATLSTVAATVWLGAIGGILLAVVPTRSTGRGAPRGGPGGALPAAFYGLLLGHAAAWIGLYASRIGLPIVMAESGWSLAAISSTTALGGLCTLPLPLVLGRLSDRVGRAAPLAASYVAGACGLLVLASADAIAAYWAVALLTSIMSVSLPLGAAAVTDLVDDLDAQHAVTLFTNAPWLAGALGFALTGVAIEALGPSTAFAATAVLPAAAALLARRHRRPATAARASTTPRTEHEPTGHAP